MHPSRLLLPWLTALLALTGCATFDDFLGVTLGDAPAVAIDEPLRPTDHDTLVIVGVDGAGVIDGLQYRPLALFLHNTGREVVAGKATGGATTYLPLTPIDRRRFPELTETVPNLDGLDLFALRLRGMELAPSDAPASRTLGGHRLHNMSPRQAGSVSGRRIVVVAHPLDPRQSEHFAALLGAVFADGDDLP